MFLYNQGFIDLSIGIILYHQTCYQLVSSTIIKLSIGIIKLSSVYHKFIIWYHQVIPWYHQVIPWYHQVIIWYHQVIPWYHHLVSSYREHLVSSSLSPNRGFVSLQYIPNFIVNIASVGQRIVISDVQESLHFVRYKRQENSMVIFADDTYARWVTATCVLDYDTVMCADKFGNISVVSSSNMSFLFHCSCLLEHNLGKNILLIIFFTEVYIYTGLGILVKFPFNLYVLFSSGYFGNWSSHSLYQMGTWSKQVCCQFVTHFQILMFVFFFNISITVFF